MHHFFETQECCLGDSTKHVHLVLVSMNWLLTVSNLSRKAHMAAGLHSMYMYRYSVPCSCWNESKDFEVASHESCVLKVHRLKLLAS